MLLAGLLLASPSPAAAGDKVPIGVLYKNPDCGCCDAYGKYLQENGVPVRAVSTEHAKALQAAAGIPAALESCHFLEIGGYAVAGHVPMTAIGKLLTERPAVKGISLPGMPLGSPGMAGEKTAPFTIYSISESSHAVFLIE